MSVLRPEPENKRVMLVRDGLRPRGLADFTPHRYVKTEECVLGSGPAWEHIFECEVTGARRRFGAEKRSDLSEPEVLS